MRPYTPYNRAIEPARIGLGQFSPFINPFEVTGDQAPTTASRPPSGSAIVGPGPSIKPAMVLGGLAMAGLSAATAYVGVSYGMDKTKKKLQRAVGWTVGVAGALAGIVRLAATTAILFMPAPTSAPTVMAGRR
jgi:hypothetical protein